MYCEFCNEYFEYCTCEKGIAYRKSASNELLGGREAGNNNSGDGKLNSPPLGSHECRRCLGNGYTIFHEDGRTYQDRCSYCGGTGAK